MTACARAGMDAKDCAKAYDSFGIKSFRVVRTDTSIEEITQEENQTCK